MTENTKPLATYAFILDKALESAGINKSQAAKIIGISPQNFNQKLKRGTISAKSLFTIAQYFDMNFEIRFTPRGTSVVVVADSNLEEVQKYTVSFSSPASLQGTYSDGTYTLILNMDRYIFLDGANPVDTGTWEATGDKDTIMLSNGEKVELLDQKTAWYKESKLKKA